MTRVSFLAFYYALNCLFAAETFSIMLTLPLFVLCCINVYRIKERYVVPADMLWVIVYLFFVIGPCQVINGSNVGKYSGPVAGVSFSQSELIETALIILSFFTTVTITSHLFSKSRTDVYATRPVSFEIRPQSIGFLLAISIIGFVAYIAFSGGFSNVLSARNSQKIDDISAVNVAFLALHIVATFLIAVVVRTRANAKISVWALIVSVTMLMIAQNPFNTARYFLLASWFPLVFIYMRGRISVFKFNAGLFLALIVLMPALSFTTRFGGDFSAALEEIDVQDAFFHIPFIDVFDMLAYEVKYLSQSSYFWGEKTLGILLFFIPRAFWAGKPSLLAIDMGTQLAGAKVAGTSNLSLTFAGELYADLGFTGVILGAILTTAILRRFWLIAYTINGLPLGSFIAIAALPILIRGPMGAVAPLSAIEFLSLALILFFLATRTNYGGQSVSTPKRRSKFALGRNNRQLAQYDGWTRE